jgi:hypothetical protein
MHPLTEAVETTLKELVIAMRWQRRHLESTAFKEKRANKATGSAIAG